MKTVCLYFQVHQPWRLKTYRFFNIGKDHNYLDDLTNRAIMQKIARECYLPMNALLLKLIKENKGAFRISFSITGTAVEQFKAYAPEVLDSFRALVDQDDQWQDARDRHHEGARHEKHLHRRGVWTSGRADRAADLHSVHRRVLFLHRHGQRDPHRLDPTDRSRPYPTRPAVPHLQARDRGDELLARLCSRVRLLPPPHDQDQGHQARQDHQGEGIRPNKKGSAMPNFS